MHNKEKKLKNFWTKMFIVMIICQIILTNSVPNILAEEGLPKIPVVEIDGPIKVHPNQNIQYIISFTNEGDGDAISVDVFELLPRFTEYIDSSPQGNYNQEDHCITWNFPTIQQSQTIEIIINLRVMENAHHLYSLEYWVEVRYEDNMQNSYGPVDKVVSSTIVAKPICDIKCEVPDTADAGFEYNYLIEVFNQGYPSALNVEVIDYLSNDAIYFNSNPPGMYNEIEHSVTWTFDFIEPDQIVNIQLTVFTDINLPAATVLVNSIEVWWEDSEGTQYGPVSDEDSTTITGDWVIGDSEIITRSNDLMVITGSIIIESGGKLTLDNVKLQLKKPEIDDFGIMIMGGGELITLGNTNFIAYSEEYPYFFEVNGFATLTDTLVSRIKGSNQNYGGIVINDGGELHSIKSTIASGETVGITVENGGTAIIDSSYIKLNNGNGIHAEGDVSIEKSFIENNIGAGIYWVRDGGTSQLELNKVYIEKNAIGIFGECLDTNTGTNIKLENVVLKDNYIDNIILFNFKPHLRGKDLQLNDDTIIISSNTISTQSLPIKQDIQVKVLDIEYDPVVDTNVFVDDWEEDPACNEDTDEEGFVNDIEIVEKVGTPIEGLVPTDYLTTEDLSIMPFLNSYFEIVEAECQMKDGYYFNIIEENEWAYESYDITVDSSYIALDGYEVINPRGVIYSDSSFVNNQGINAFDYNLETNWRADKEIGNYELLIDLTDSQPIRYLNIHYQYVEEQSWFEGESYTIEGYNENSEEWEIMLSVVEEENIQVREAEAPFKYWDEENPSGWVSKVRMVIPDWNGIYDPCLKLINVQDSDLDGLLNWYEVLITTKPLATDTDGDGMSDGYETKYGTNTLGSWFDPKTVNNRYAVLCTIDDSYANGAKGRVWAKYQPIFWDDVMLGYHMLTQRGFTSTNIHMLYEIGSMSPNNNWISWYPKLGVNIVDGPGTLASIDATFTTLSSQITANDLLFVFLADHGGQINPAGNPLWGEIRLREAPYPTGSPILRNNIYDFEFDAFMDRINPDARKVIVCDACNSGTFIDDLTDPTDLKNINRIVISHAPYNRWAWANTFKFNYQGTNYYVAPFTNLGYHFLGSLNWMYNNNNSGWIWTGGFYNSKYCFMEDVNSDDEISIYEAYLNEEINDPIGKNLPKYDDDFNPWDQYINNKALDPDGPGVTFIRGPPGWGFGDGPLGKGTFLGGPSLTKPRGLHQSSTKINHYWIPF